MHEGEQQLKHQEGELEQADRQIKRQEAALQGLATERAQREKWARTLQASRPCVARVYRLPNL